MVYAGMRVIRKPLEAHDGLVASVVEYAVLVVEDVLHIYLHWQALAPPAFFQSQTAFEAVLHEIDRIGEVGGASGLDDGKIEGRGVGAAIEMIDTVQHDFGIDQHLFAQIPPDAVAGDSRAQGDEGRMDGVGPQRAQFARGGIVAPAVFEMNGTHCPILHVEMSYLALDRDRYRGMRQRFHHRIECGELGPRRAQIATCAGTASATPLDRTAQFRGGHCEVIAVALFDHDLVGCAEMMGRLGVRAGPRVETVELVRSSDEHELLDLLPVGHQVVVFDRPIRTHSGRSSDLEIGRVHARCKRPPAIRAASEPDGEVPRLFASGRMTESLLRQDVGVRPVPELPVFRIVVASLQHENAVIRTFLEIALEEEQRAEARTDHDEVPAGLGRRLFGRDELHRP